MSGPVWGPVKPDLEKIVLVPSWQSTCDDGSVPAVSMDDCNALAEAMRAEVCRALAGGAACPLTVEHVAQIVVPRVLTSVQHWQDQPVIAGLLVEDRVAVAAGATPAPAHTEVGSCVNSTDADGDGGSSPDSRGDTCDCGVPGTILGELDGGDGGSSPDSRGDTGDCGVPGTILGELERGKETLSSSG